MAYQATNQRTKKLFRFDFEIRNQIQQHLTLATLKSPVYLHFAYVWEYLALGTTYFSVFWCILFEYCQLSVCDQRVFKYLWYIWNWDCLKREVCSKVFDIVHKVFYSQCRVALMKQNMRKYFRYRNESYVALTLDLTGIRSYKIDICKGQLSKEKLKIEWKVFKENGE